MEKNPFSLFDFLGYFIPGAFAMFLVYFLQNPQGLEYYFTSTNISSLQTEISIIYLTFFIILSYTLGHVLSFLSTLTIENFTIWMFGYPFKNLIGIYRIEHYYVRKMKNPLQIDWTITILSFFLRSLLALFLIPISICSISIGRILNLNNSIYKKELQEPYPHLLRNKITEVFHAIDPQLRIDFNNCDYNKLLIHHSYHINLAHQPKLMNYVALYGFLRVTSFTFNVLSIYLFVHLLLMPDLNFSLTILTNKQYISEIIIFLISSFMTYVTYLGYLKFYRRYTQENLMILLLKP